MCVDMTYVKNAIIIPGGLIALATFPGVMMHELSHYLMCRLFSVHVSEIKLFSLKPAHFTFSSEVPLGWVSHTIPKKYYQTVLISSAPIVFNTIVAVALYISALTYFQIGPFHYVLLYLGFCCAVNAFPSKGDGNVLLNSAREELRKKNYFAILSYPIILVIFVMHYLSRAWLDFAYGCILYIFVNVYV